MRIWHVPFGELDHHRLLGQHREMHMLESKILGGGWGGLYAKDYPYFRWTHDRAVAEMNIRGMHGHRTPMDETIGGIHVTESIGHLDTHLGGLRLRRQSDRRDLVFRWNSIYQGRIPWEQLSPEATVDYELAYISLREQDGCKHNGPLENFAFWELCLICKRYIREKGSDVWEPKSVAGAGGRPALVRRIHS